MASLAYSRRSLAHYGKGDYQLAIADADLALESGPFSAKTVARTLRVRGYAKLAKGEKEPARADLEKAEALGYDPQGWWEGQYIEPIIKCRMQTESARAER